MIYKYYGPPGTGKTYKLISRAKAYHRTGTPLHRIGYFAFTKKAATEAKRRMPAEDKKLIYFRTLHSLGFDCLDIDKEDVMQPYHYEEFGKKINLQVKFYDRYNKDESFYLGFENPYFQIIHRSINRCVDLKEEFNLEEHDPKTVEWAPLKHIYDNLKKFKEKKKLLDFNDMVKMLTDKPEKILKYSKRISKSVQQQSIVPINNIVGIRKLKQYYPRNYEGLCEEINNVDEIDLTKGKWLILTRTISRLLKIQDQLISKGLYFESNKGKSIKVRMYKASKNYELWRNGKELNEEDIKDIQDFAGKGNWNANHNWFTAFKLAEDEDKEYLLHTLDNKENLDEPARIWLSTIHAIKGGEQDNVILCLDIGDKILKSIKRSQDKQDEEHRVWYVGITRARNNLYKLKARITRKGYEL